MDSVTVWNTPVPTSWLSNDSEAYLKGLPEHLPSVDWVWKEMDRVWLSYGLDNQAPLEGQPIGAFYQHPVWLMNGLFTQLDPVSAEHRKSIACYLKSKGAYMVADFGGGFGELALTMTRQAPCFSVTIIEPYPSQAGLERIRDNKAIRFSDRIEEDAFEAIIAQDVLEHVEDPVKLASELAMGVKLGQYVVFANCFRPVILCHLPAAFHLRHTFPWVMRAMGLEYVGRVPGAEHAQVFRRTGDVNLGRARAAEYLSRLANPMINVLHDMASRVKSALVKK